MPADLKTYLSDLEAAQGKIASEAGRGSCSTTGKTSGVRVSENISLAAGEIRGSINRALTQDSFGAVTETFRRIGGGELPRAVRDQLNTLLRTQESIGRSIELVYGQCASGRAVNPREILGNLAQDGASENATLGDTTSELMTRHVALTVAYREAVNATPFSENSLKYVPEKLRASLTQNYGLSAIESCTKK